MGMDDWTAPHDQSWGQDFRGLTPESWDCVDCGINTAPGLLNRLQMERAAEALGRRWHEGEGIAQTINNCSEVYTVREIIWKKAGMEKMGGCLCVGCLEKRLGRNLKPKDFLRGHPLNAVPGTSRLLQRRK